MGPHNLKFVRENSSTQFPKKLCFSHSPTRNSVQSPSLVIFSPKVIAQCSFPGPRQATTAHKLTDDALLDIFDFYLNDNKDPYRVENLDEWHTLVHVCRRWRDLVFASPRRLNLQLLCSDRRPVRETLDIWPALPIDVHDPWIRRPDVGLDNVIAALEHPDRVRSVHLADVPSLAWEALAAAMRVPFPELTHLRLRSDYRSTSVLPDSFLGGSAPRLHTLWLAGISAFPALPTLLLSASGLVYLTLRCGPHSRYISPEAMVDGLSSLSKLEYLELEFEPHQYPDQPSPPPQTRVVLPALTTLSFTGMTDYSEDFLARIDTPVLNNFSMSFFPGPDPAFDVPHSKQFISRSTGLRPPKVARVHYDRWCIPSELKLNQKHGSILELRCHSMDLIALVCGQLSPVFSLIEQLDLFTSHSPCGPRGDDDRYSTEILELFRPFIAIQSLHVSRNFVPLIAIALRGLIGPRATEVLPNLRDLFLGGSVMPGTVPEAMQPFVATRRLSGRPVAIHHWEGSTADW